MAQLAIKGHPTRGKEVIQLLEMLGGVKHYDLKGTVDSYYYYIDNLNNKIYPCLGPNIENAIVFTLEEFEKEYPYKVGDKVVYKHDNITYFIVKMFWKNDKILYELSDEVCLEECNKPYILITDVDVVKLQPYKEETNMKDGEVILCEVNMEDNKVMGSRIDFSLTERIELDLGDTHEVVVENGKTYVVKKKPTYPKYYTECEASELSLNPVDVAVAQGVCMGAFAKLIVIRNAYWEIAGKQLGLDKPWKYDMSKDDFAYAIVYQYGCIQKCEVRHKNHILVFPTKEIRDVFYENFNEEIEMCKELL